MMRAKGQSLIELIVAVAVIQVGLFSIWSLFLVNFNAEKEAEYRIVGVNLAREGIEVIKNIRDANWQKRQYNVMANETQIYSWDQNLTAGTWSVNFSSRVPNAETMSALYFDSAGFFTTAKTASTTPYSRQIKIKNICCADANSDYKCDNTNYYLSSDYCASKIGINVVSQVNWQITGHQRQSIIEDNLYDWQ